jgi:hypothetical protein
MSTTHKLLATIPHGDPDLGAECEAMITFTFRKGSPDYWNKSGGHWEQGWDAEIEFHSAAPYCNGKPAPFQASTVEVRLLQAWLGDLAEDWLATDDGLAKAFDKVRDDDDAAREYAAELRADR